MYEVDERDSVIELRDVPRPAFECIARRYASQLERGSVAAVAAARPAAWS